jgi:hypothetical protein
MYRYLHKFNNNYFFISNKSFCQHIKIQKNLRQYVNTLICNFFNNTKIVNTNNSINSFKHSLFTIVCIGGESYLYGMSNNFNKIIHYTNSKYIYNDVENNNQIYKKNIENNLINYNKYQYIKNGNMLIINIAKLNLNIIKQCNSRFFKYIIIINCHHIEFWNRIKLLNNYKIINRKQFIVTNYFVTVSILEYKSNIPIYIPLGNTCAIAYQLNKYGLRTMPLPFDWCKIDIKQLNNILDNEFNKFEDLTVVKFSEKHKLLDNDFGSYILKNKYNIIFAHELYIINSYNITSLQNNIKKRIKNFYNLKSYKIRFIIHNSIVDNYNLNKLIIHLKKYFNNFIIIYITNINKFDNNDLTVKNNIYYIYIDYNIINWQDWHLSSINWFNILFDNYE